jgi:hypothetical protein
VRVIAELEVVDLQLLQLLDVRGGRGVGGQVILELARLIPPSLRLSMFSSSDLIAGTDSQFLVHAGVQFSAWRQWAYGVSQMRNRVNHSQESQESG